MAIDSEQFKHIQAFEQLSILSLRHTRINNEHLSYLPGLDKLEIIDLYRCTGYDHNAMRDLNKLPSLRKLIIAYARIDDYGLRILQQSKQLEHLNIVGTEVTPEGLVRFKTAVPDCDLVIRQGEMFQLPKEHLTRPDRPRPNQERPDRPRPQDRPPRRDQQR